MVPGWHFTSRRTPTSRDACGVILDGACGGLPGGATLTAPTGVWIDGRAEEGHVQRRVCPKHGKEHPCTCAMGNVYRFVEPVILLLLKQKGRSHGYDLSGALTEHALTDATVERAALYRTLRQLELNGNVASSWETESAGPARRVYTITAQGEQHLQEWATVLDHLSTSMSRFVRAARRSRRGNRPAPAGSR